MSFNMKNIEQARKAGYTDDDIIDILAKEYPDSKIKKAYSAGYSIDEISETVGNLKAKSGNTPDEILGKGLEYGGKAAKFVMDTVKEKRPLLGKAMELGQQFAKTPVGHAAIRTMSAAPDLALGAISKAASNIPGLEKIYREGDIGNIFSSIISQDPKDQPERQSARLQNVGVPENTAKVIGGIADIGAGLVTGKIGGNITQRLGHSLHRLPFKNINKTTRAGGNVDVSDVLFSERFKGSPSKLIKRNITPEKKASFGKDFDKRFDVEMDEGLFNKYLKKYNEQSKNILKEVKEKSTPLELGDPVTKKLTLTKKVVTKPEETAIGSYSDDVIPDQRTLDGISLKKIKPESKLSDTFQDDILGKKVDKADDLYESFLDDTKEARVGYSEPFSNNALSDKLKGKRFKTSEVSKDVEVPYDYKVFPAGGKKALIDKNYDVHIGKVISESDSIKKLMTEAQSLAAENPSLAGMVDEMAEVYGSMSKKGYMNVEAVSELKNTLQKLAKKFKSGHEALTGTKPNEYVEGLYKRASGSINTALKEAIGKHSPELAEKYIRNMNKSGVIREVYKPVHNMSMSSSRSPIDVSPFAVAGATKGYPELFVASEALKGLKNAAIPTSIGMGVSDFGRFNPYLTTGAKAYDVLNKDEK